jgi:hypothetical protein
MTSKAEWNRDLVYTIVSDYVRKHGSPDIDQIKKLLLEAGVEASDAVILSRVKIYEGNNGYKRNG